MALTATIGTNGVYAPVKSDCQHYWQPIDGVQCLSPERMSRLMGVSVTREIRLPDFIKDLMENRINDASDWLVNAVVRAVNNKQEEVCMADAEALKVWQDIKTKKLYHDACFDENEPRDGFKLMPVDHEYDEDDECASCGVSLAKDANEIPDKPEEDDDEDDTDADDDVEPSPRG